MNRLSLIFLLALSACTLAPNANVYCDGTTNWPCNDPSYPLCDVGAHLCVQSDDMGAIEMSGDGNAVCSSSAQCPDTAPICDGGACRSCMGGTDDGECKNHNPATPRCDAQTHSCVACLPANGTQSPDCTNGTAPICGTDTACRGCQAQSECASLVCNTDGSCAATTDVVYADNQNGTCTGTHTGTLGDRYCEIQTAITMGGKAIVRVFGSSTAYAALSISSGTVSVVGPTSGTSAKVSGGLSTPAIGMSGATTTVVVDSIEVTGGGTSQDGIDCSNTSLGPSLSVLRSNIHGVSGAGINASKCKVTLDRDAIGPSCAGGGIVLSGSQYSITNCFVVANVSTTQPGITLSNGTAEIPGGLGFKHNTVAGNALGLSSPGGIACPVGGPTVIANSIVSGNSKSGIGAAATQFSGNCSFTYVDTDDGTTPSGTGNTSAMPDFVSTTPSSPDYHLTGKTSNNLACCIDKIPSSPVLYDYDGRTRPQGAAWDIGAHEVP